MLTYITFPEGWDTDALTKAGALVSDLSPYLSLILGVLLGIVVVTFLIRALVHH